MYTKEDVYEKPEPRLEPGEELCDCGRVRFIDDRHRCVNCNTVGCSACMHTVNLTNDDADEDWVCGDEHETTCEIEWIEFNQKANTQTFHSIQDVLGKKIESARLRQRQARARQLAQEIQVKGYAVMEDDEGRGNEQVEAA